MDKPTVRAVLEELVKKFEPDRKYLEKSTMGKLLIDQALARLDALYKAKYLGMLPEERVLDYSKTDFVSNNTDALYGFNSAIQEMREKIG
jgi:hypothetical protein